MSTTPTLADVVKFLLGEGDLDGWWFGDRPINQGSYWWRSALREAYRQALSETRESEEHGVAHHGAPILTQRDYGYARAMVEWIRAVRQSNGFGYDQRWLPSDVDIIKSRLFWRLRSGKAPLPHRPPTCYSCPWYEVVEELSPHWTHECWVSTDGPAPSAVIGQCGYGIEKTAEDGFPEIVTFGPWRFNVRKGKHPNSDKVDGYYIQRIEP